MEAPTKSNAHATKVRIHRPMRFRWGIMFFPELIGVTLSYDRERSRRSKRLSQRYKYLNRLQSRNGVQAAPDIDSHWSDGRLVAEAYTNRITVVVNQIVKVNRLIYVSSVIKDYAAKAFFKRDGEACL